VTTIDFLTLDVELAEPERWRVRHRRYRPVWCASRRTRTFANYRLFRESGTTDWSAGICAPIHAASGLPADATLRTASASPDALTRVASNGQPPAPA
jgi:hypothetical protein